MKAKSLFTILLIYVIGNHAWAAGCDAHEVTLKKGQWKQISLPCAPGRRADTVADIFGKSFDGAAYGTDWLVFSWDGSKYIKMSEKGDSGVAEGDFLEQGKGYWIIQAKSDSLELRMPSSASPTPTDYQDFTGKVGFKHALSTSAAVTWNFLGNPFINGIQLKVSPGDFGVGDNPVVQTKTGTPCAKSGPTEGCGLVGANKKEIFHDVLYRYNAETEDYDKLGDGGQLRPWDGFWSATLKQAPSTDPNFILMKP